VGVAAVVLVAAASIVASEGGGVKGERIPGGGCGHPAGQADHVSPRVDIDVVEQADLRTWTKSSSPIQTARSAKASRIASIMTCKVWVAPKPKPWLACSSGNRSNILSIWIHGETARGGRRHRLEGIAAIVPPVGFRIFTP